VRRPRCALIAAILSAICVTGCEGGKEVETVPFKTTDTSQFNAMKDQMTKDLKADKSGAPIHR
jgi:hypothetical protein